MWLMYYWIVVEDFFKRLWEKETRPGKTPMTTRYFWMQIIGSSFLLGWTIPELLLGVGPWWNTVVCAVGFISALALLPLTAYTRIREQTWDFDKGKPK